MSSVSDAGSFQINTRAIRRDHWIRQIGNVGLWLNPVFSYFFLWAPIIILILFSFNSSRSVARFTGFSLHWYENIMNDIVGNEPNFSTQLMLQSVRNSLIVSCISTMISTVLGTMVAMSLVRGNFPGKRVLDAVLFLPIVIPEITQGVSLAIFFNVIFKWYNGLEGTRINFGLHTIIIAHVAFSISFVAVVVRARMTDMNPRLEEAARDLGASEWQTFWRVTFPLILPGVLAGALLAFTLSLDDFVVTFFTKGVRQDTLPVYVFGLLKLNVTPEVNAISTIMVVASTLLIGFSIILQGRNVTRA